MYIHVQGGHVRYHMFWRLGQFKPMWQRETQETEADNEEAKVNAHSSNDGKEAKNIVDSRNIKMEMAKCSTKRADDGNVWVLHARSRNLGINRYKTQEKDSDGEEARVKANLCNKEFEQNMTMDGDGQASHEDMKDVIKTSNKDTTMNESKFLEKGDDRDKGGTFMRLKRLYSRREQGAMATSHGKAKKRRMVWWPAWQP